MKYTIDSRFRWLAASKIISTRDFQVNCADPPNTTFAGTKGHLSRKDYIFLRWWSLRTNEKQVCYPSTHSCQEQREMDMCTAGKVSTESMLYLNQLIAELGEEKLNLAEAKQDEIIRNPRENPALNIDQNDDSSSSVPVTRVANANFCDDWRTNENTTKCTDYPEITRNKHIFEWLEICLVDSGEYAASSGSSRRADYFVNKKLTPATFCRRFKWRRFVATSVDSDRMVLLRGAIELIRKDHSSENVLCFLRLTSSYSSFSHESVQRCYTGAYKNTCHVDRRQKSEEDKTYRDSKHLHNSHGLR